MKEEIVIIQGMVKYFSLNSRIQGRTHQGKKTVFIDAQSAFLDIAIKLDEKYVEISVRDRFSSKRLLHARGYLSNLKKGIKMVSEILKKTQNTTL